MEYFLFIDTSDHLVVGLLNQDFDLVEWIETPEKKSSGIIHSLIDDLLNERKIEILKIKAVFTIAGPGSYTGIRLSAGIAQIFEWHKIPILSIYHFEVPRMLGREKGIWMSNAFKGEFFIYKWNKEVGEKILIAADKVQVELELYKERGYQLFTHYPPLNVGYDLHFSGELLKKESKTLFSAVYDRRIQRDNFYFRATEKEFKTLEE